MGAKSDIAWLYDPRTERQGATWNPVRGCSKESAGCANCFAEGIAKRFCGPGLPYEGVANEKGWTGDVKLVEKHLLDPLRWKKPKFIFVNSMWDMFHPNVPFEWIDRIVAIIALCPQHIFLSLTKRAERQHEYFSDLAYRTEMIGIEAEHISGRDRHQSDGTPTWSLPLKNWWKGITVENQAMADKRIPWLLKTPAAVRWISAEPMLGALDLTLYGEEGSWHDTLQGYGLCDGMNEQGRTAKLDWVVCGAESGSKRRPLNLDDARSLHHQCAAAGVPFFAKQFEINGTVTDNISLFPADLQVREYPL